MTEKEMATKFDPQAVEEGRYQWWIDQGFFKPSGDKKAHPYSIVIPPPNVTGKLHLGHAWDTTLQDIIIRQKRMQGYDVLWLPGMDHAGIATQAKVEARLAKQGVSRYDLGREKFVKQVWDWKDEYAAIIHQQWAKMGISVDYDRERFTLDEGLNKAVRKVFVDLYNKGLIYRATYIINWDPKARTALSDIEVEHKDDKGAFYHVKYPFTDGTTFNGKDYIEIATTRPETMFGDEAVAVNPSDERYKELVGKHVMVPLVNREIEIIADDYVTPDFGTGMVKIDPIVHSVGHSERTGVQVESRLSTQWFVKMKPLAERALANQKTDDRVNFIPERFEHTFNQWMENVHDWVISRQLWWGHQIPAWYHKETGEMYVGMEAPADAENWVQDKDVLDTWFSSALWPFSTMGWPNTDAEDFKRYFPTTTLVTGYDIIFFWVSRMIFQSLEFTGKAPFRNVLLHGLIRDEQGRKMSKSLGNGIDPMDVVEKYGVDALRWFLVTGSTPGQDIRFSYKKMDASWNFINKIWNASRYVIMNLGDMPAPQLPDQSKWDLADRWILSRLNTTVKDVTAKFEKFEFGEAGRDLYNFIWNDFCDWYIEMTKEKLTNGTDEEKDVTKNILGYVLDQTLKLIHPIMPFVTEKLWQAMPHDGQSIMVADYPVEHVELANQKAEGEMEDLIELIKAVRNIRNQAGAPMSSPVKMMIKVDDQAHAAVFNENRDYLDRFCHPSDLTIATEVDVPKLAMSGILAGATVYIPMAELVDLDEERARMEKEITKLEKEVARSTKKLGNEKFVNSAPEQVVAKERAKAEEWQQKLASAKERLASLQEG